MTNKLFRGFLACMMATTLAFTATLPLNLLKAGADEEQAQTAVSPLDDNQFYYVAIGDSITAGYGIDDSELPSGGWNHMTVGGNYKNCPKESYPAVIAENVKTQLEKTGYFDDGLHTFDYANLGAPGFMSADFVSTIMDPDYVAFMWQMISGSNPEPYKAHKYYVEEIAKADLISIHIGSNDLLVAEIFNMYANLGHNKLGTTVINTLINLFLVLGTPEEIIEKLITKIETYFNETDAETIVKDVTELLEIFSLSNFQQSLLNDSKNIMTMYDLLIQQIRKINPYAQLVFVGYEQAFGNSLECDGKTYTLPGVIGNALSYVKDSLSEKEIVTPSDAFIRLNEKINQFFNSLNGRIDSIFDRINDILDLINKENKSLEVSEVMAETAEPLGVGIQSLTPDQYLTIGKSVLSMAMDLISQSEEFFGTSKDYIDLAKDLSNTDKWSRLLAKFLLSSSEKRSEIFNGLVGFASYPLVYSLLSLPTMPAIASMNENLQAKAAAYGVPFIDIFDIPNENNANPHPLTAGHKYIAEKILEQIVLNPLNNVTISGSGTVDMSETIILGNNATFKAIANPHGAILSIKVDGKEVDHDNGVFTVKSFNTNTKIEIQFSEHSEEWFYNNTEHWKKCSCGKISYAGNHAFDNGVVTQKATYLSAGNMRYTCSDCGYEYNVKIEKLTIFQTLNSVIARIRALFPF